MIAIPENELKYITARSGGHGGQNVNKIESKVKVIWCIDDTTVLSTRQKELVYKNLAKRIEKNEDSKKCLYVVSQKTKYQNRNKKIAIEIMQKELNMAIIPPKKRVTKMKFGIKRKRKEESKRINSLNKKKKEGRRSIRFSKSQD